MSAPLLATIDIRKTFPGRLGSEVAVVDGVNLEIHEEEIVGLVGQSGCGKSTLVSMLAGLLRPTAGGVRFRGEPLPRRLRSSPYRRAVQMVFQDPYSSLSPTIPVGVALEEVLAVHQLVPPERRRQAAVELLESVGVARNKFHERPAAFSGGQRQLIAIARALAAEPQVLLCDEPVTSLDVSIRGQIMNLLREINAQRGVAFLVVAHDLSLIRKFCSRAYVMAGGRIVEEGTSAEIWRNPQSQAARELLDAVPRLPEAGPRPEGCRP